MKSMIRPYRPGEENYVADLHKRLYSEEYGWGPEFIRYAVHIAEDFAEKERSDREAMYVAEEDGCPVGSIMLCGTDDPAVGQLRLFAVEKAYRCRGIGAALLQTAIEKAKSAGYTKLILWTADMEPVTVDKPCCQVDILPTVSNLLGLEYDSRMLAGRDILSDEEGLVIFASRCWLTDRGFYDRFSGTFTPAAGVRMSEEETARYVQDMNALVGYRLDCTQLIMQTDFYEQAFGDRPRAVGRLADLTVEECAPEETPQVSETGEEAETETAGPPASAESPSAAGTQRNTETAPGPGADGVPEETMEPEGTWDPENAG